MKLRPYLRQSGKSCRKFASEINASTAQVCRLASGKRIPSLTLAERIERATGGAVRPGDFLQQEAATESSILAEVA